MKQLPDKAYYSPEEVGAYLDVSPETIRNLCRAGSIPGARQVGRQWRIPRSYLDNPPDLSEQEKDNDRRK
jgi:excisionase family DNA binding protein